MGRLLAIDYGKKRVGIAVSDPLQIIATGLKTIPATEVFAFLHDYLATETVDALIIGEAKHLDNTPSDSATIIEPFVQKITKTFPQIPVFRIDERFTSTIASQTIAKSGLKKKDRQNKALIDTVSAVLILQSYMAMPVSARTHMTNTK